MFEIDEAADEVQRTVVGFGIPPEDAADAVFAAISENRFFVLPHLRAALQYVENRLVWMQGGEPAAFDIESLIRP